MAKLVTKFKYLKPSDRNRVGGYAKYIATREGVEKIDDTAKLEPATKGQKEIIKKIIRDFPDTKEMLEYADYLQNAAIGNASEFISRAIEDNADEVMNSKTYADYIATRPRAARFDSHGLFTDDGVRVKLGEVSKELNEYDGNLWTVIISLHREDAERLGFNTGERWRDMLRAQTAAIADSFKMAFIFPHGKQFCDITFSYTPCAVDKQCGLAVAFVFPFNQLVIYFSFKHRSLLPT